MQYKEKVGSINKIKGLDKLREHLPPSAQSPLTKESDLNPNRPEATAAFQELLSLLAACQGYQNQLPDLVQQQTKKTTKAVDHWNRLSLQTRKKR